MQAVAGRDATVLLDAAHALACLRAPGEVRQSAVLWALRMVPADRAGWVHVDLSAGRVSGHHIPEQIPILLDQLPRELRAMPLTDSLAARPGLDVRKISDHLSRREWHNMPIYADFYRPNGAEHHIAAPVTMLDLRTGRRKEFESLSLVRGRGDFTERDRAVLTELSRHVRAAHDRLGEDDHQRHGLTLRQLQALRAIADGSTMRSAARALGVTEKTLENHLQGAYRRLGVTNRIAALAALGDFPHVTRGRRAME